MVYQVLDDNGNPLDAHFELDGSTLIYRSRGGSQPQGPDTAVNVDYLPGLRLLLRRLTDSRIAVERAWVDSRIVQTLPIEQREILGPKDHGASPEQMFTFLTQRMKQIGRADDAEQTGGNPTKRIRLKLPDATKHEQVLAVVRGIPVDADFRSDDRLPAEEFDKVTAENLWRAVQKLLGGYQGHSFGPSTDYDILLDDGQRLAPKAVFGIAATEALGRQILPRNFAGGLNSICFRALEKAGFEIVAKGQPGRGEAGSGSRSEWDEGSKELRSHQKRERGAGLGEAKKAQFRREHNGRLFCERCNMDPVAVFGSLDGEACIEAHHSKVQVQDMAEGHKTRLEDLQCLCANCHRVVHRLLRKAASG